MFSRSFVTMATNLPSCFSIQFLELLLKFLVNFTLLKYVKSQRSYGFLITKELIFDFQILDLKDHFSASLTMIVIVKLDKFLEFFWKELKIQNYDETVLRSLPNVLSRQLDNDDVNDDENDIDIFSRTDKHRTYEISQRKQFVPHESI